MPHNLGGSREPCHLTLLFWASGARVASLCGIVFLMVAEKQRERQGGRGPNAHFKGRPPMT